MKNTSTSSVREGNFVHADDVEIEIKEVIPQPDKVETNILRVEDIKNEIKDLDKAIATATERKAFLQSILTVNKDLIEKAVKQ
jgi:hypothetical protein